jgi:hypothetical protein
LGCGDRCWFWTEYVCGSIFSLSANAADAGGGDCEDADALKLPPAAVLPVLVYSASSGDDTFDVEKRDGEEDDDEEEDDDGDDSDNDDSDGGEGVGSGRRNDGSEAL